jgi:GT2 family glycosyltransferase
MHESDAESPSTDSERSRRPLRALWSAGIVNHGSYDDLEKCLTSLSRQVHPPIAVAVYDTGRDRGKFEALRAAHPRVDFEIGPNRGYAGGANEVLARTTSTTPHPSFCLILNPDVELDTEFSERLVDAMNAHPEVAIAAGKLLRPDRLTIDSAGIRFPRHGRPRDRGSEEEDHGQFDQSEFVDAVSGAAMMIRVDALDDLRVDDEIFDEDFFAYHEDTDLCWRARRLGWKILYEPDALGVHSRGWRKERRHEIQISIRRHSFKNHYLQLVKNQSRVGFIANSPWLVTWEALRFGFVLLRDRPMLSAYREAWNALPASLRKRQVIRRRIEDPASGPSART